MIEHLIDKTEQQKQLEAWNDFLEFTLDRESKKLITQLGIISIVREMRARGRYTVNMTYITPVKEVRHELER